ncbi:acyl-CoA ligase (AMP-forming), exosortase A system-associated [Archangium sp.]|uniref:acyl-CoA ligase (AMP-forming), exosortase A system-associated n=1 Tax=Archangium sp. TaxID=1872627 RepID=UPI00286C6E85|nr:acyl-CoA ligase (AMP-forming), exosortase A system-associated [Archangium sp.]
MYLLHHLLERSAASTPDKEALVDGTRRFSYAGLLSAARTLGCVLRREGLERRDRVAVFLPKCAEEATAFFGVSLASGVVVPINSQLRPAQVAHILNDCGVRFLLTSAQRWEELRTAGVEVSSLVRVLLVDAPAGTPEPRVLPEVFATPLAEPTPDTCIGEDLAAILYTSGSTGRPKGVMLSHRNLLAGSRIVCKYLGIRHEERILSILPFSFDYGLNQLLTAVEKGATLVLLTFRFPMDIVRALQDERITGLAGVPTLWTVLLQAASSLEKGRPPTLRYLTNSGGAVPSETVRRLRTLLPDTSLFLMYGLTEAFRSTFLPPEQADVRPTSIGKAIPETEIFVVDEQGRRCAPGEVGFLVHRGPTVSLGYWNRPEDTARVLRPHPGILPNQGGDTVCYSGDRVRMDEEGFLYFVGRDDGLIKVAGHRISPTEVEEVLMATGLLAQAAVIGLPDAASGQRIHAVVVGSEGNAPDVAALLAHCARQLPTHMLPKQIEVVPELPRTPNGKVDYQGLRATRSEAGR